MMETFVDTEIDLQVTVAGATFRAYDVPVRVHYEARPEVRRTRWYPGDPAEVVVGKVEPIDACTGKPVPGQEFTDLPATLDDLLWEVCCEDAYEQDQRALG